MELLLLSKLSLNVLTVKLFFALSSNKSFWKIYAVGPNI